MKPCIIESPSELDTLPVGTVVRDAVDGVYDRWRSDGRWHRTGTAGPYVTPALPARVVEFGADS